MFFCDYSVDDEDEDVYPFLQLEDTYMGDDIAIVDPVQGTIIFPEIAEYADPEFAGYFVGLCKEALEAFVTIKKMKDEETEDD